MRGWLDVGGNDSTASASARQTSPDHLFVSIAAGPVALRKSLKVFSCLRLTAHRVRLRSDRNGSSGAGSTGQLTAL